MAGGAARAVARPLSLLVPLGAALWMWWPLVGAYFYADDFLHLFDLVTLGPRRFLTQIWGGHLLVVPNAVLLAMYELFGPEPRAWFWLVLLTHLANVALLHRVIRRLGGGLAVACLGATLWGTAPLLEGALGWYSVYGQVLLTTLVLLVLGRFASIVSTGATLPVRAAVLWGSLLMAGGACFGNGLGIAAAFPVAVLLALPPKRRAPGALPVLVLAAGVILALYTAARVAAAPDLDPRARVLLSPQALLGELPAAAALTAQLVGFGAFNLPFGFLGLAADAPATAMALGGLVAAALALTGWLAADAPARRTQLARGLLALAAYGTVAVGRTTSLEFLNLTPAHAATWPRYHYVGLALLTVAGCGALVALRTRGRELAAAVSGAALAWTALRLVVLLLRPPALDLHDGARAETAATLVRILTAIGAAPAGGVATIDNRPFAAAAVPWLFPGSAGLFVIHFPENTVSGRTVRFRASNAEWTLAQSRGGRIAALVERRDAGPPVAGDARAPRAGD